MLYVSNSQLDRTTVSRHRNEAEATKKVLMRYLQVHHWLVAMLPPWSTSEQCPNRTICNASELARHIYWDPTPHSC